MAIGINFEKDRDDDYDMPMFGRHWLDDKDNNHYSSSILTKEEMLVALQALPTKDLKWIYQQINKTK